MNLAPASLLAQLINSASASLAYSATQQTEITRIVVCNTTAQNDKFSIWHSDGGGGFSDFSALFISNVISGQTTVQPVIANEPGTGISIKAGGRLGVLSSGTMALTFSIYGITRAGR